MTDETETLFSHLLRDGKGSPTLFDAYEVSPVLRMRGGAEFNMDGEEADFERLAVGDAYSGDIVEAKLYSVFGHIPGKGLEDIADFTRLEYAEQLAARLGSDDPHKRFTAYDIEPVLEFEAAPGEGNGHCEAIDHITWQKAEIGRPLEPGAVLVGRTSPYIVKDKFWGLYGRDPEGLAEHIRDAKSPQELADLYALITGRPPMVGTGLAPRDLTREQAEEEAGGDALRP